MQRIDTLLQKLNELARLKDKATLIEIDLMMDYTKVIYADLIEWRNRTQFIDKIPTETINTDNATAAKEIPITATGLKNNNIETYIGINDKYQYISELFNNDTALYLDVINTLNSFENYTQASNWILSNYHWDDEHEIAQSFMQQLDRYFNGK